MSSNTHYQSIRDDSEQRQSLSDEDDISRAIFHVREHRCTRTIIFIAAVVVLIAAGLSVFLLVYVFVNHHVQWLGDQTIATTANLQDIFTISNALCIFVSLTVPLIISLHGYGVAAEWLEASRVAGSSDRPSPLQLGLLMSILQGANILSWLKVQSHLSQITRDGKRQTISPSRLLTHAAHALGLLLALAYLTTALDFWFHLSSESKALAVVLPHTPVMGDTLFGKQINETLCALYGSNATALDYQTSLGSICRLVLADPRNWPNTLAVSDLQNYFSASRLEGDRTALNTSTLNQVVFTDDQQAILVPPYIPPNVTFEADTVGVRITCQSVTKNCVDTNSTTEAPNFNCHGSPNLVIDNKAVQASPRSGEPVFGIINETGQVSSSNYPGYLPAFATVQSNPFQLASLIMTEAYVIPNQENYTFIGDTGFYYGVGGAYSLQLCEVVVNDVTYQYGSPNGSETSGFHTVSSNPSSLLTTTLIATSIDSPQIELLDFSFEPFGPPEPNIISEAYSYAYALTLSQTLLAISATIFDGSQARSLKSTQVLLGSKLHLPPLVLTLAAALAYCLCTIHIAYNAVLKSWSVDFVKLAHGHIMSPGPILRLMFNRSEPLEIWRVSDWPEVESDRLIVGIVKTREGRLVFGVTQGAQSASDARLLMSSLLVAHEAHQDGEATRDPVLGTAAQKGSIAPIVLLWLISTTLMFVPATILIVYVFNTNSFSRHGPTILTAAPLQYVLAIFKALSTAASLVPPLVTSMYAYSAASEWLRSSKVLDSTATPSPQRLGELISIVQGANLFVFFQSLHHLLPSNKRKRLPVPHILAHALLVVALLLTFSSLASGFDTWLHVSSSANIIEVFHPRPLSDVTLFGKQINETQCAYYATNPAGVTDPVHPDLPQLCGLYVPGAINDLYSAAEGLRTLYNTSESNRVAFTQDRHAILVPASFPSDVQYTASTVGVLSTCQSITSRCVNPANHTAPSVEALPWLNCTGSPPVDIDNSLLQYYNVFGIVNATGYMVSGNDPPSAPWAYQQTKSNPFSLVGASIAAAPPGQQNQSSDEGYFTDLGYYVAPGGGFGVNILYCNVTVGDVVYRYSSSTSTFQTVSFNDSSLRTTQLVATLSDSGDMSANIAFILLAGASADEYALELSREMIGMSAWIWQPAQIQMINGIEQIIGTKIHTIPLILYLATIGSMCILTLAVCVQATVRSYKVPFTHLARMRLTSLLPMIHLLFGPIDAARTWKEGGTGLFNVESEAHRLNIGPIETLGERSFGVTMAEVEADSAPPTDLEGNHNAEESVRRRRRRNVLELDTEEVGDAKERYLIPDLRLSPAFPSSVSELEESCGLLDGNPM
ncbi:hypothetical protein FRB96_000925 [Tulasnella sp. 330]|nr:hypothetical protein FRB96_000925 [Tulasnella sp. 330]